MLYEALANIGNDEVTVKKGERVTEEVVLSFPERTRAKFTPIKSEQTSVSSEETKEEEKTTSSKGKK